MYCPHLLDKKAKVNSVQLTKNFNLNEFACKGSVSGCCQGAVKVSPVLVLQLQKLREKLDRPVIITSGYRCETHNERVGGVPGSYHLYGMAADIISPGVGVPQVAAAAEGLFPFILQYDSHVHVDTR